MIYLSLAIASFIVGYVFGYDATEPERALLVVGKDCWHVHHWLLITLGLASGTILSFLDRRVLNAAVAVALGLVLEGMLYRNFLSIHEDCDKAFTTAPLSMEQYRRYKERDGWPGQILHNVGSLRPGTVPYPGD